MAAGHNALRGAGPGQKHALQVALWHEWVVPVCGPTGVGALFDQLPFPTSLRGESLPRVLVLLPYAGVGSGVR